MKNRLFALILFSMLLLLPAAAAAGPPAGDRALKQEAARIVQKFAGTMKPLLKETIRSKGLSRAISVCAEEAPKIAARLSRETGWTIRRVSLNPRNRKSATPDPFEKKVLEQFDRRRARGESAERMAHAERTGTRFRFMKAQGVGGICLGCHGQKLNAGVRAAIDKHYPEDIATGYSIGEIRGAVSLIKSFSD